MKHSICMAFVALSLFAIGQAPRQESQLTERIKSQKIAFITEKLNLSSEEAEKFWPIYNEFDAVSETVKRYKLRGIKQKLREQPNISDEEADDLLKQFIAAENKLHNAKMQLIKDLKGVISSRKIIKLKRVEDDFNRKLLKRLKDTKQRRPR